MVSLLTNFCFEISHYYTRKHVIEVKIHEYLGSDCNDNERSYFNSLYSAYLVIFKIEIVSYYDFEF